MMYALRDVANNQIIFINTQRICHKNNHTMSDTLRWKAGCKADKILDEMFMSGQLGADAKPKPTHILNEEFKKYKLESFRTQFNKKKAKHGTALVKYVSKPTVEESETEPGQFVGSLTPAKRDFEETDDNESYESYGTYNFYLLSQWEHPETGKKFCDVFIILPSGLQDNESYEINVSACATKLDMKLIWPSAISDLQTVMKIARLQDATITSFHPMLGGVTENYKKLKATMHSNIKRDYIIPLPYDVQSNFVFINCVRPMTADGKERGSTVHLRVEGIQDNYANATRASGKISTVIL